MAKGNVMGVIRRKLGNMVGFGNALVNGKDKQVWRIYNGAVKNPKTTAQNKQRSLFVAVKNFVQGCQPIINHSWQGKEYGTPSLNYFRKLVLANGGANYPNFFYQPKGSFDLIPQPWPMSQGSLPSINIPDDSVIESINADMEIFSSGIIFPQGSYTTNQEWYQAFLAANAGRIMDGDQITICTILARGLANFLTPSGQSIDPEIIRNAEYYFTYDRLTLNGELFNDENAMVSANGTFCLEPGSNCIVLTYPEVTYLPIAGLAIILSRQNGTKGSWLRSPAVMKIHPAVAAAFGDAGWAQSAIDSFATSEDASTSDWYLNQTGSGDTTSAGQVEQVLVANRTATLSNGRQVSLAYYNRSQSNGFLYQDIDGTRYFYTLAGRVLTPVALGAGVGVVPNNIISVTAAGQYLNAYTIMGADSSDGSTAVVLAMGPVTNRAGATVQALLYNGIPLVKGENTGDWGVVELPDGDDDQPGGYFLQGKLLALTGTTITQASATTDLPAGTTLRYITDELYNSLVDAGYTFDPTGKDNWN